MHCQASPRSHSRLDMLFMCITFGIYYSLVGWLTYLGLEFYDPVSSTSAWASGLFGRLPFVGIFGGLMGVLWFGFGIPILHRRPLRPCILVLGVALTPLAICIVLIRALSVTRGIVMYSLVPMPTIVFVFTCLVLRRVLPETLPVTVCGECGREMSAETYGVCYSCGDISRYRKHCRQIGLVGCFGISLSAVIAGLFVVTGTSACGYWTDRVVVGIGHGALFIECEPLRYVGWFWGYSSFVWKSGLVWWPAFTGGIVLVPLWMVLALILPPSLLLWRRSRRHPPGFCDNCDYNLTGLVSDRCPECGENIGGCCP